jgi:hypothetical protein
MNRMSLAALFAAGFALSAQAQTYQDSGGTIVRGVVPIQPGVGPLFTPANPGKISGSFSASLSGFQPTPSYASLSVGATSARVALPGGTVVVVYNTGSNAAYVTLGGAGVTAITSDDFVPAGGWMAFAVGSNAYLAAIETAGGTTLNLSGGSGLPTGACCAAGGGASGSNASVGSTGSAIPGSATLGGMSVAGTMTAMPGTSNGLKVDGSAVTQPVSAASLPLPTGAATAANQAAVQASFGSAAPATGIAVGARAENAEPTPASNGNLAGLAVGLEGKLITLPFANKENMVRGSASQTGTGPTTIIAAQGAGVKIYVTGVQCKNTGSTTTIVTLDDSASSVLIVPTSGGDNETYQTPLVVAANTALTFTPGAASSTIYCNAQGYWGS